MGSRTFSAEPPGDAAIYACDHRGQFRLCGAITPVTISFESATLNSAAASPDASTSPIQMAAFDWLQGFQFLCHAARIVPLYVSSIWTMRPRSSG
jgi:hypothetical protein